MRIYGFPLTCILPYNDKIVDSVLTWKKRISEHPYSRMYYEGKVLTKGQEISQDVIQLNKFSIN